MAEAKYAGLFWRGLAWRDPALAGYMSMFFAHAADEERQRHLTISVSSIQSDCDLSS